MDWLIDDKLIPYDYIASDKQIRAYPENNSDSKSRPDLVAFDNPMAFTVGKEEIISTIAVIEFKKPMREDYKNSKQHPIDQVVNYVREIKKGYSVDFEGRHIK